MIRKRLSTISACLLVAWLCACTPATNDATNGASNTEGQPNILIIYAWGLSHEAVHPFDVSAVETPNIDTLVNDGFSFSNAYTMGSLEESVDTASAAMLLTGQGLFSLENNGATIPKRHRTIPEHFRKAGYDTFISGAWRNDVDSLKRGFDNSKVELSGGDQPSSSAESATAIVEFIDGRNGRTPFVAIASLSEAELANSTPSKTSPSDDGSQAAIGISEYYTRVSKLDAQIGSVLAALERNGLDENTIILLTSSHGYALGRNGKQGNRNVHDHTMQIPLVFYGLGIPEGKQSHSFVYSMDVFPTLATLTGIDKPASLEGADLAAYFTGEQESQRDYVFLAYADTQRSLRDTQYKLIEYADGDELRTELFELDTDTLEIDSLYDEHPYYNQIAYEMRASMEEIQPLYGDTLLLPDQPAPLDVASQE